MESETKPNKAHHENGQKEPLDPVKIAPTYLQSGQVKLTEDLRNKQKRQSHLTLPALGRYPGNRGS